MRLAKCNGERCGATYPSHARFCPRCGKAIDVVATPVSRPLPTYRRRRGFPILRCLLLFWLVVFAVKSFRHAVSQPPVATPAPVIVSPPTFPQDSPGPEVRPDLTSLDAFAVWRANHRLTEQSRKQLEGRDIRWTGTLKKSFIPGRYDLAQLDSQGNQSVRMIPVTDDAKQDLGRLQSGAQIEIEGILMDEHSLHLVTVRELQ